MTTVELQAIELGVIALVGVREIHALMTDTTCDVVESLERLADRLERLFDDLGLNDVPSPQRMKASGEC